MNRGPYLFLGAFVVLAFSWTAAILANQLGYGAVTPHYDDLAGQAFPAKQPGVVARGAQVYTDLGCATCHTQQVRRADLASDLARGWGERASVGRDYIQETIVQLGSNHIGPDLRNVGARYESPHAFYELLYSPSENFAMPAYRFLFEETEINGQASDDAIRVDVASGSQVVPTERARSLVAYLAYRNDTYAYPETHYIPPEPEAEEAAEAEEEVN
jgi:cytochrome c oxidase cbb3-type subunit 2